MKRDYTTAVVIRATPAAVWRVLIDTAGYAAWNPEIVGLSGRVALGNRLTAKVKVPGGAIRSLGLQVTAFDDGRRMEWTGGLPFGLFVGRRVLSVAPHSEGAEFRMDLSMTGPLAGPISKSTGDRQAEVDSFSAALKARVESLVG